MSSRMTRAANRRNFRRGIYTANLAGFILMIVLLSKSYNWIAEGSILYPILVLLVGVTAIPAFLFLVILGIMPHLFRMHLNHVASDNQKRRLLQIDFIILED